MSKWCIAKVLIYDLLKHIDILKYWNIAFLDKRLVYNLIFTVESNFTAILHESMEFYKSAYNWSRCIAVYHLPIVNYLLINHTFNKLMYIKSKENDSQE